MNMPRFWRAFARVTACTFAVAESYALVTGKETLSQTSRGWLRAQRKRCPLRSPRCAVFLAFLVWLGGHLAADRWSLDPRSWR